MTHSIDSGKTDWCTAVVVAASYFITTYRLQGLQLGRAAMQLDLGIFRDGMFSTKMATSCLVLLAIVLVAAFVPICAVMSSRRSGDRLHASPSKDPGSPKPVSVENTNRWGRARTAAPEYFKPGAGLKRPTVNMSEFRSDQQRLSRQMNPQQ